MNFFDCVLDFIYPPVCGICLKNGDGDICPKCKEWVKFKSKNKVDKYKDKYFRYHLYIFEYEGIIRKRILEYKFKNKSYLHRSFSKMILCNEDTINFIKGYDCIMPVPIHKERKKQRGYNQSELITRDISLAIKCLTDKKITHEKNVLIKNVNVIAQSSLNKQKRQENVKNVYDVRNVHKIVAKKVLLLDDIYTTGSTVNECAKALKDSGAEEVGVITIAKD